MDAAGFAQRDERAIRRLGELLLLAAVTTQHAETALAVQRAKFAGRCRTSSWRRRGKVEKGTTVEKEENERKKKDAADCQWEA